MNKRNLYLVLSMLAVAFLTGVVYAAVSGTLTLGGTSRFNPNVKLNIIDQTVVGPEAGDSAVVTDNGDTLNFSLAMPEPGTSRYVKFKVRNTGNVNAQLGALSHTSQTLSGITVTWPDLSGVLIAQGADSPEYTIQVYWEPAYGHVIEDVDFSASITYQQV